MQDFAPMTGTSIMIDDDSSPMSQNSMGACARGLVTPSPGETLC